MIYRDKIDLDGRKIRANVRVASSARRWESGALIDQTAIVCTVPARAGASVGNLQSLIWHGRTFIISGPPTPIVSLGRVDHYEIAATWSEPQ